MGRIKKDTLYTSYPVYPGYLVFIFCPLFLLTLLCFPSLLPAQPPQLLGRMQLAKNLFEAGEFQEAISKYEDLLDYPLLPWQTALVKYNIATVLLGSGKWVDALFQFQSIPAINLPAQLEANLKRNISLADLMQLKAQVDVLKTAQTADAFEQANFLFLQFHLDFEAAVQAACRLSQAIGAQSCRIPPELAEIEQAAAAQFSRYLEALSNFQPAANLQTNAPKDTPQAVLKKIILNQETAKQMAQLQQMSGKGTEDLHTVQQKVVGIAAEFVKNVLQTQKQDFSSLNSLGTRCQCHPWDKVIPLFFEGKAQAENAAFLLSSESLDQTHAQQAQQMALLKWKEALALLQKSEQEASEKSQEEAKAPEKAADAEAQAKEATQANRDILRSLQDMQEDDRSNPTNVVSPGKQGEKRPW